MKWQVSRAIGGKYPIVDKPTPTGVNAAITSLRPLESTEAAGRYPFGRNRSQLAF